VPEPTDPARTRRARRRHDGSTIADIAGRLHVPESTVRNYLSAAIQKTRSRNRIEAAQVAGENGWF
jgi:two-component system response regulator DesR